MQTLCDLSPVIADVTQKDHSGEPYVAPDMLLAICQYIEAHNLSEREVCELLARPNWEGFPCLDATTTSTVLSAYYDSDRAGPDAGAGTDWPPAAEALPSIHIGARIAARVTLVRVERALEALPRLAFSGPGNRMHLRRLRDCLELKATAEDILLQRPTGARRRTREFAAAWLLDELNLKKHAGWDGAVPSVDEVRTTQDMREAYGTCHVVGTWLDDAGCADHIGGPDTYDREIARQQQIFCLPSDTSGSLPLHPVFTTEHDFVWCLPPAPFWWEQAMRQVRWTLYHAATEAANQGGSLRLRPPPKTKPDPFLLRRAVVIANADPHGGQALRRIQRLFLGWGD
ncbi:MAG: hypothetical protein ACO3CU_11950, partial [Candidatus Nanopelagicales bacterium]